MVKSCCRATIAGLIVEFGFHGNTDNTKPNYKTLRRFIVQMSCIHMTNISSNMPNCDCDACQPELNTKQREDITSHVRASTAVRRPQLTKR